MLEDILKIYSLKTANLISASAEIGVAAADTKDIYLSDAKIYGNNVGLCFQIIDDILDKEFENIEKFGGVKEAKDYARKLSNQAKNSLDVFKGDSGFLLELADYLLSRLY